MSTGFYQLASSNLHTLTHLFFNKEIKKFVLDPLTCIIRCAILAFKPYGTKISILKNKITYHEPTLLQGTIRWSQGDKREDLHNIYNPILKSTQWYSKENPDILNIFKLAQKGLEKLKNSYESSSIISHSLELYINIIDLFINSNSECMNDFFKNKQTQKLYGEKTTPDIKKDEEEDNKLYKSLKQLWNDRQISIVNNILQQVEKEPLYKEDWLQSLDVILNSKEHQVYSIVNKNSTSL